MPPKTTNIILPPEASTNWLFSHHVIFNLLVENKRICMDIQDFLRYKRLASRSSLDLTKSFLLELLRKIGALEVFDYTMLCSPAEVSNMLKSIKDFRLLKDTKKHEDVVFSGYHQYLNYISGKEKVLPYIGDVSDNKAYISEQNAAQRDLDAINRGLFTEEDRCSYLRRLSTKLLSAQVICKKLNGMIFDSLEYQGGVDLLKKEGLFSEAILFDKNLYNNRTSFDKLISLCETTESFHNRFKWLKEPGFIDIWLPYLFLERISKQDNESMSMLKKELLHKTVNELKIEVLEWYMENQNLPRNDLWKKCTSILIGLIPPASLLWGLKNMVDLRSTANEMYKSNFSTASQLIGIALMAEQSAGIFELNKKIHEWTVWFSSILKEPEKDWAWIVSQREMGAWTNTELYVPWYEHSQIRLKQLRLV